MGKSLVVEFSKKFIAVVVVILVVAVIAVIDHFNATSEPTGNDTDPVAAAKTFFTSINKGKHQYGWSAFTENSRKYFTHRMAEANDIEYNEARKQLDLPSSKISSVFWGWFKGKTRFKYYKGGAAFKLKKQTGDSALVLMKSGNNVVDLKI